MSLAATRDGGTRTRASGFTAGSGSEFRGVACLVPAAWASNYYICRCSNRTRSLTVHCWAATFRWRRFLQRGPLGSAVLAFLVAYLPRICAGIVANIKRSKKPRAQTLKNLTIIGGGSWGTALAIVLAPRFSRVRLWVYESDLAARITETRINDVYLPGSIISTNVDVTAEIEPALEGAEIVLGVMPSHLARGMYQRMRPFINDRMIFVSATKGLENHTLLRMSEIIPDVLGPVPVGVFRALFAKEVARYEPTALVAAATDPTIANAIQAAFSGPTFRVYTSPDPIGVEVGGSIKNVVAIGAGVLHGMGLGHNAMAALITRGLAEMTRLAVAMGGRQQTLAGLAGLGDLVLTCTGDLSRNRTLGVELAKGRKLDEIVSSMKMVAEGVKTTNAAVDLAKRFAVEMPIAEQMFQMLHFGCSPQDAIRRLMERSLKGE